jgi:hypothetical protein
MRGDTRRRRDTRYGDDADKFGDGQFDGLVGGDAVEVIVELRVHVPQARDKKLLAPSDNNHAPHTTCTRGEEEREREIERERRQKREDKSIKEKASYVAGGQHAREALLPVRRTPSAQMSATRARSTKNRWKTHRLRRHL